MIQMTNQKLFLINHKHNKLQLKMKEKSDPYQFMSNGQKFRIKKVDIIFWFIILIFGGLSLLMFGKLGNAISLTQNSLLALICGTIAIGASILYFPILIIKFLFHWGRTENLTRQQALGKIKAKNTSNWIKSKAIIIQTIPHANIVENGEIVAKLTSFKIKLEHYEGIPMITKADIFDVIIPLADLPKFGINTKINVLVSPNRLTAVFDTETKS